MRRILFYAVLSVWMVGPAGAQIHDTFSDYDLARNPPWTGDIARWQTGLLLGSPALQSAGEARSDTISLGLHTGAAFGRWSLSFAHRNVNLSTFNGARVFISVDAADATGPINGYYVQIGTNNSDVLSFWRVDGHLGKRTELARSSEPIVRGDSSDLDLVVERDASSRWVVRVDGSSVLEVTDARYVNGSRLLIWVKHTAQGANAFFFDNLYVTSEDVTPPPPEPPPTLPQRGEIVVNEIHYDPLPEGSEFIELFNRSDSTYDLRRLTFRDSRSPPLAITEEPIHLEPGGYAVIVADGASFSRKYRRVEHVEPARWASLNNGGDVVLIEAGGEVVDSMSYAGGQTTRGVAYERVDPDGPSESFNFAPSVSPFGATPGEQNSVFKLDVDGPVLLFAEEKGDRRIDLYFDEPLSSLTASRVSMGSVLPDSVVATDESVYAAFFPRALAASFVDVREISDRKGNVTKALSAPVAFRPREGDLAVNEIMYEPLADAYDRRPNQSEYVEIVNRSPRRLTLDGLYSTRRPDEFGNADTLAVGARRTAIEPGEMYVVVRDTAFSLPFGAVSVIAGLSLRNGGDVFRLHAASGILIDSVAYRPSWHHPDLLVSRGVSLERIDVYGPSSDPQNWTSSVDPSGGTPGRPNSVRLSTPDPTEKFGVSISPNPFSPDRDGFDDTAAIAFRLRSDVALLRARIFDDRGHLVRDLIPAKIVAREGTMYWDGRDNLGRRLRTGIYVVLVEAFDNGRHASEAYKAAIVLAHKLR